MEAAALRVACSGAWLRPLLGRFVVALLVTTSAHADVVSSFWFADRATLKRVDVDTNAIAQSVSPSSEPQALAVDPRTGSLWAVSKERLLKFDTTGALQQNTVLGISSGDGQRSYLVVDPYAGSVWIARDKLLLRFDSSGKWLGQVSLPDSAQGLSLDVDETIFVLTSKSLLHFSVQGTLRRQVDLKQLLSTPRFLSVDGLGGAIWVASRKKVLRFNLNQIDLAPKVIDVPNLRTDFDDEYGDEWDDADDNSQRILGIATHPIFGTLWVAVKDALFFFDRSGNLIKSADLSPYAFRKLRALAYEPFGAGLWLAGRRTLLRLTTNGDVAATLPVDDVRMFGVAASRVQPAVSIRIPTDGAVSNNPYLPFRVGLGATCNDIPCMLADGYLGSLVLDARLNDQPIGPFQIVGDEAQFSPLNRLPEGASLFSVIATDLFGHSSNQAISRFTIDTIAPKFLGLVPASGSTLSTSVATIQGTLDDPTATIVLMNGAGEALTMTSGATFSFAVALNVGANTFTLVAHDRAGNTTSASLVLNLNSVNVVVTSIASGATVTTDNLSLSGDIDGPDNTGVTVNGVVATVVNGKFYVNDLRLEPGSNTVTVTATTPDGQTVTKTITVVSAAKSPFELTLSPQTGAAPLLVTLSAASRGTNGISQIAVDFDGDGIVDTATDAASPVVFRYLVPGIYQPRITITDSRGASSTQSLTVVVFDPVQMDRLFSSLWNGMNDALKTGNTARAVKYLNAAAQQKYQPVFEALTLHMAEIVASFSPLQRVSISEDIGEYAVVRLNNGRKQLYLVYFLRDADGVWRVDGM